MDVKNRFRFLAEGYGWTVIKENPFQGFGNNWDFELEWGNSGPVKVDVKGAKKIGRHDLELQYDWHWIEIKSTNGQDGWILDKNSDWIAFQTLMGFMIVERARIIELIQETVDLTKIVSSPESAKHGIYSRAGKSEAITLVETVALKTISIHHWE